MSNYEKTRALWRSYNVRTAADLDRVLSSYRVLFAYNSGKIENPEITYHDTREIFENSRVTGFSGNTRVIFEQQNQRLCYEFLKERIINKVLLSVELVKEVHKILTAGTYDDARYISNNERPGEFKKHDYVTGLLEVGAVSSEVETELQSLIDEINDYRGNDPLKPAAYFHARFEYIHPFADGNGRVGRTLLNYYLMINDHPPLIVYDEDKRFYYEALEKYDSDEEIQPLYAFLQYETEKTWAKTLKNSEKG